MATATATQQFRPYRAIDVPVTRDAVFDTCNRAMFSGYGPGVIDPQPMAYPLFEYDRLLAAFAAMPHVEVVTLGDLCRQPASPDRVRLAIRHDVDGDIVAAWQMARLEARYGLPASFYMLHTASYHGRFDGGTFERNACIGFLYREMQDLGHEIGLHTDGITVYQQHKVDGAAAVRDEIDWMRSIGLDVRGTVSHGSTAAFGAENFEIFKGRRKGEARMADYAADEPRPLAFNGTNAWLSMLNETDLGLDYEGNDVFWQKDVGVEYGATRAVDGWRWNRMLRVWRKDDTDVGPEFCPQPRLLADVNDLEPGVCVVLTVHPCYYGLRDGPDRIPVLRSNRVAMTVHPELGWETFSPETTHAGTNDQDQPQDYQAIHAANDWGMLDVAKASGDTPHRVLFIGGGAAMVGREVCGPSHFAHIVEGMLRRATGDNARCTIAATPDIGVSRWWSWLETLLPRVRPTLVLLGIAANEPRRALPPVWSVESGYSRHHPPGGFLDWQNGEMVEVPRSSRWRLRQRTPRTLTHWPNTEFPMTDLLARVGALRADGIRAKPYLEACYTRVASLVRDAGAAAAVLLTDAGRDDPSGVRAAAASIATTAEVPLLDPTSALETSPDRRLSLRHADGTWTPDGHRIAARAVLDDAINAGLLSVEARRI